MPANENVFLGRLLFSKVPRVPQGIIGKTRLKFWMHLPCCSVPSGLRSCMALLVLASFSQQRNEGSMSA